MYSETLARFSPGKIVSPPRFATSGSGKTMRASFSSVGRAEKQTENDYKIGFSTGRRLSCQGKVCNSLF